MIWAIIYLLGMIPTYSAVHGQMGSCEDDEAMTMALILTLWPAAVAVGAMAIAGRWG